MSVFIRIRIFRLEFFVHLYVIEWRPNIRGVISLHLLRINKDGLYDAMWSKWENKQYTVSLVSWRLLSYRGRTRHYTVKWSLVHGDDVALRSVPTLHSLHHARDKWLPFAP